MQAVDKTTLELVEVLDRNEKRGTVLIETPEGEKKWVPEESLIFKFVSTLAAILPYVLQIIKLFR